MKQRSKRLNRNFFEKPAKLLAGQLLGKKIIRILPSGKRLEATITEVEAYVGVEDKASHCFGGRRSARSGVMYGKAGLAYVYFTYGMHFMFNVVASKVDDPQAVLIRGTDIVEGPGRFTKYFQIDRRLNGEDLTKNRKIWIEETGIKYQDGQIKKLPRIGVNYAGEWKDKPLRFKYEER